MHVLVTVFWHTRSAAALVERYGHGVVEAAIARRAGAVTDVFRPGDRLPGEVEAIPTARATEVVFWIPGDRAPVPGDVLLGTARAGSACARSRGYPTGRGTPSSPLRFDFAELVERVRSHGEPVLDGARDALAAALAV